MCFDIDFDNPTINTNGHGKITCSVAAPAECRHAASKPGTLSGQPGSNRGFDRDDGLRQRRIVGTEMHRTPAPYSGSTPRCWKAIMSYGRIRSEPTMTSTPPIVSTAVGPSRIDRRPMVRPVVTKFPTEMALTRNIPGLRPQTFGAVPATKV
ncbi:hypothetical protein F503_03101 [Ophiostoma piceae UAMH 11346]|uniref:Uncharacterized protein n=1 Tax=Ophiostoma piceae (strain UAMH 11346) TaxID=1262450 RepID=S3BZI1_OPHP1|nr:hypothetical protein F503_03101 [Ophiostoma piceae UAMH 11346]